MYAGGYIGSEWDDSRVLWSSKTAINCSSFIKKWHLFLYLLNLGRSSDSLCEKQCCISSKVEPQEVFPICLLFLGNSCQPNILGLECWLIQETNGPTIAPDDSQPACKVELPDALAADCMCLSASSQDQQKNYSADPSLNCYLLSCELQINGSCFKILTFG